MDRHQLMMKEWESWQSVCHELKVLGVDINEQDNLTRLIKEWGYAFSELPTYRPKEDGSGLEYIPKEELEQY